MSELLDNVRSPLPLSENAKREIATKIFGAQATSAAEKVEDSNSVAFWNFYQKRCSALAGHASIETHEDLLEFADYIRASHARRQGGRHPSIEIYQNHPEFAEVFRTGHTRCEVEEEFLDRLTERGLQANKDTIQVSTDLAASFLMMTEVGNHAVRGSEGRLKPVPWRPDQTLADVVDAIYLDRTNLNDNNIQLPRSFTAFNLSRIAGMRVQWTWSLADHLRLTDDETKVHLFTGLAPVEWELANSVKTPGRVGPQSLTGRIGDNTFLPKEMLHEVRRTLTLLFPRSDLKAWRWYREQAKEHGLDTWLLHYPSLDAEDRRIEKFKYFHDRLVVLKQCYDDAKPSSISQFFHDRRDGTAFFKFCNATSMLVIAIVSAVYALVQIVLAAFALKYAIIQVQQSQPAGQSNSGRAERAS